MNTDITITTRHPAFRNAVELLIELRGYFNASVTGGHYAKRVNEVANALKELEQTHDR